MRAGRQGVKRFQVGGGEEESRDMEDVRVRLVPSTLMLSMSNVPLYVFRAQNW
jgi:hypothetical protein